MFGAKKEGGRRGKRRGKGRGRRKEQGRRGRGRGRRQTRSTCTLCASTQRTHKYLVQRLRKVPDSLYQHPATATQQKIWHCYTGHVSYDLLTCWRSKISCLKWSSLHEDCCSVWERLMRNSLSCRSEQMHRDKGRGQRGVKCDCHVTIREIW